jgi:Ni,Fe-hydrogenase III large subunit
VVAHLEGDYVAKVSVTPGYCARGVRVLAPGKPLADVLDLVERSCSQAGAAHRLAACMAVEGAQSLSVSPRDALIRTLFVEVERALARLWLLGQSSRFAGFPQLWRASLEQRESLFDALVQGTGERRFWGVSVPGGIRDDIDWEPVCAALEAIAPAVAQWQTSASPKGPLGRSTALIGTLPADQARSLDVSGLAGMAAGVATDKRRSSPYDGYRALSFSWPDETEAGADVGGRLRMAAEDLAVTITLAERIRDALSTAETAKSIQAGTAGQATVEGPHGPATVSLAVDASGKVTSLAIETAAPTTIAALDTTLSGSLISQAPLVLASMDICPECADL